MINGKKISIKPRLALTALVAVAFAGMNGLGHAEGASEATQPAQSFAVSANQPRFVPTDEANFEASFEAYADEAELPALPVHAVDITTIEPAEEDAAQDLGTGIASYYADRFNGRPTASGERFDQQDLTAAHRTLPFGSRVRVTNPRNGASVVVRINDRGPFTRGRTIDLSRLAAEQVGIVRAGHGTVKLELIDG